MGTYKGVASRSAEACLRTPMRIGKPRERRLLPGALLLAAASSALGAPSRIAEIKTYGCFETAGVIIKVDKMDFDETASIEYRRSGETAYKRGHDFVRYDGNHMATSLFGLQLNSTYEIRATLADPDGTMGKNPQTSTVKTRAEYALPNPVRTVNVSSQQQLDAAVRNARPGDEIRLAAGTYSGGIHIFGKSGNAAHPIVFTSQGTVRAVVQGTSDGGVQLENANYYVLDNLEIHNEKGDGVYIRGSHDIVIRRCYIHDSLPGDYTSNVTIQHSEEANPPYAGNHLIMDNVIGDDKHDPVDENQGPGPSYENTPGQSYFGISMFYQPGAFVTIRGNTIYGVVDGIHPAGDEGGEPVLGPDDKDVLDTWRDQNLDLYDNVICDCKDDAIECDGHITNGRIFRNRIGKCENAITTSPFYPGPLFVLRNFIHGFHQGCLKQNTGVEGITRKVFFYHNTIMEKTRASRPHCESEYCLYRGEPALQQDFVYKNNVFFARGRVYNGDMYTEDNYHKNDVFDYNLMYSTRQTDREVAYKWVCEYGDPLNNTRYETMAAFRAAVKQETHGKWANPRLRTNLLPGYPASSKLLDLRLKPGSPAIDAGVVIPGINDAYSGAAPDIGADETMPGRTSQ
ncbi:MAG: right-handed parallel beta-helix repeat-containing protein [Acidobacteriota bacterium]